ncbi:hypothetical protein SY2F82_43890 [Streptomyces sp. Y2F8-2]|nr:hypothetical protein SY2F82_43890 [Streptomyces sp. Y2F8-2]
MPSVLQPYVGRNRKRLRRRARGTVGAASPHGPSPRSGLFGEYERVGPRQARLAKATSGVVLHPYDVVNRTPCRQAA